MKIIPWDHQKKDYVYSAIQESDVRGFDGGRKELKKRMDIFKQAEWWDPVSCYNITKVIFAVIIGLILVGILLYVIINFESAKKYWYLLITIPVVAIVIGIILMLALRNRSNRMTFVRKATLDEELAKLSKGAACKIRTGEASSYLEVF